MRIEHDGIWYIYLYNLKVNYDQNGAVKIKSS